MQPRHHTSHLCARTYASRLPTPPTLTRTVRPPLRSPTATPWHVPSHSALATGRCDPQAAARRWRFHRLWRLESARGRSDGCQVGEDAELRRGERRPVTSKPHRSSARPSSPCLLRFHVPIPLSPVAVAHEGESSVGICSRDLELAIGPHTYLDPR